MGKKLKLLNRKDKIITAFSVLLGLAGILTKVFFKSSFTQNREMGLSVSIFTVKNLVFFIVFTFICYVALQRILAWLIVLDIHDQDMPDKGDKKICVKVFLINIVCWGVWFWLYFPGTGMNDTINCIRSIHNDNQPLIYQIFVYYGMNGLTKLTSSMTISYAILTMGQMILMALCVAWIAKWLYKKRVRRFFINLFVIYYALSPIVADYSITLVKDTLFGMCMMLSIPFLYDFINKEMDFIKNRKLCTSFLFVLLGICFLRSNGKFIVFTLLFLLFIQIKNKRFLMTFFGIIVIVNGIIAVGEHKQVVNDVAFRESIGIPLVQIGAVLAMDGYIIEEDKEVLNNLLPLNIWEEAYCFWFSDSIKFNENFDNEWLNANKGKFIGTWFNILKDNFDIYIKAYLCHTYGFWNISPFNPTDYSQSYFTQINNNTGEDSDWGIYCATNNLVNREIQSGTVDEQMSGLLYKVFFINLLFRPGIMFWITIWFLTVICLYRRYQFCYIFLPSVINWITMMVAAPASYIYRYSFYLTLSLPLLFITTLMQVKAKNDLC